MNGPHDLGGRGSFGALNLESDEPVFHDAWESRVLGMTLACGSLGYWSLDESRHARECLPPGLYLSSSYYRIWFEALTRLLQTHGEILPAELSDGRCLQTGRAASRQLVPERVDAVLSSGAPTSRALDTQPRFAIGDSVRTMKTHIRDHCRLPGYARDKCGLVESVHEPHVFPDASARGQRDEAQWLYTIAFEGEELWGAGGEPGLSVSLEAWESYLEPA